MESLVPEDNKLGADSKPVNDFQLIGMINLGSMMQVLLYFTAVRIDWVLTC